MSGGYGVRVPSTGKPKFIMVGIDRPDGSCRLYASRELPRDVGWGMEDGDYHVDARMRNVLIIDKPTWGEAFARAFEIWANWDRNAEMEATAQALDKARTERKAVNSAAAAGIAADMRAERKALTGKILDGPAHPEAGRCEKHGEVGCAWCTPGPYPGDIELRCQVCERLAGMPTAPCPSCADWTEDTR